MNQSRLAVAGRPSAGSPRTGSLRQVAGIIVLLIAPALMPGAIASAALAEQTQLEVPIIDQSPERCGQASLEMVLRFHGADRASLAQVERAYDARLHGSLVTDLATAARRAGFRAEVATMSPDSLIRLLQAGIPTIVLYQSGRGPLTTRHFAVVTGWDSTRDRFTLNDGGERPHHAQREDLAKRWRTAGSQALIIRPITP